MTMLAAAIADIPIPLSMQALPIDRRGFPAPWFVAWEDGEPDFRVIGRGKIVQAVKQRRCWVCGGKLGRLKVSVIGPMCTVNRVSSEPPAHPACAKYAVLACPFLANPRMRRNERDLPPERIDPAGVHFARNPGVMVVWTSLHASKPFEVMIGQPGVLFELGAPEHVEWWTQGRLATRAECQEALEAGLPSLRQVAELQGDEAIEELANKSLRTLQYLPEVA